MQNSAIVERFRSAAAYHSGRAAILGGGETISYAELERRAARAARRLRQRTGGAMVALLQSNSPDFAPLFLGARWAGKTATVLPTLAPPGLLKLMAAEIGVGLVIASPELAPLAESIGLPFCLSGELLAEAAGENDELPPLEPAEATAAILYTSGTTGRPKAVALSDQNFLANVDGFSQVTGFDHTYVLLAALPLFHSYGLLGTMLLPLCKGACVVVPERFQPRQILELIERHRVTMLLAVPGQYRLLIREPAEADVSSLRLCITGAERLPESVAQDFQRRFGKTLVQGYGTTELSPVVSFSPPEDYAPGSVGRPLPNLTVTIRGSRDEILHQGETGEVCVAGPSVMLGYRNDPQGTAQKIRNGVLHTGDKGYLDQAGFLFLVGRADDLVKISGEKVYPAEVENALESIAGVVEAVVIAVADEKHGARLHAFVQLAPASTLTEAGLRNACRGGMESHKIPRTISFVEQMPRSLTGKTDKRALMATLG